jgi:hypothetical protein
MKPAALAFGLATLVFPASLAAHQLTSDFSGTWQIDMDHSDSANDGTEVVTQTLVIAQVANGLTLETHRGAQREILLFVLDGPSTDQPGDVRTRARWNGTSLVMETVRRLSGWAVTIREIWRLDDAGETLRIERVLSVEHGYEGTGASDSANNYSKVVDVYRKGQ